MEITAAQRQTIIENLQKLSALAFASSHIFDTGVPTDDVMEGWSSLFWDIEKAIHDIIAPEREGALGGEPA